MKNRILMIGHFATKKEMNDGQTVKTRNIYTELIKSIEKIETIDTQDWKKSKIKFFGEIIKKSISSKKIVLVVASNGAKVLIPILTIIKIFHKVDLYYCSVGSWLDERVKKNKILKHCCKKIDLIFVETQELEQNLQTLGYTNVKRMYNFKNIKQQDMDNDNYRKYSFCTFSRVMEEKGIEDAIEAVNRINSLDKKEIFLDIYGPIEKEYEKSFFELMNKQGKNITYKGNVNPEKSTDYLPQYYMLLFPTKYIKEGLPGTLIDAYYSGVPVIASNWKSAKEFVKEDETGLIYEFENVEDLIKKIEYSINNEKIIDKMRLKCKQFYKKFTPEEAIKPLLEVLYEGGKN